MFMQNDYKIDTYVARYMPSPRQGTDGYALFYVLISGAVV